MPSAWGMPPSPASCSITRLLSVMANWPSRKKPSRGVVAIQFGLPRPAFKNADCVVREVFLASLISSSLISNGLSVSKLRSSNTSMVISFLLTSRHEDDYDHSPNCEQGVPYGVGDGVPERGNLTFRAVAYQS